jgi:hypothetical protein
VGCDDIPYPPGTVYVQLGIGDVPDAPHGVNPVAPQGWRIIGDEWPEVSRVVSQNAVLEPPAWHAGVPVSPPPTAIVFGADFREVLPGEERPLHPLTSQCRCGRQITKLTSDGGWEHCD